MRFSRSVPAATFSAAALFASLAVPAVAASSAHASTADATSAQASSNSAAADFYTPPADVPAQPGTLMRSERFTALLSLRGNPTRLMYSSKDTNGRPVAVTGTYIEPWAKWGGPGPRPVVSFSVGTIGQGDQCAPSKMMASAINLQTVGSLGVNYEGAAINNLLAKGVAVVVTDYVGLGTPDRPHTYVNREDEAHAVLDAARVASRVPGSTVKATSKVATYGYSQGGGAAGAAAEAAPSYAPELDVTAGYVGAPPANLRKVLDGVDGSPIAGVLGYFINGASSESPAVAAFTAQNINDKGATMLARTSKQCVADTIFAFGGQQTKSYTKSGEPLSALADRNAEVAAFVDKQNLGTAAPKAAVRVATGVADDIVPHGQARQLALDWCAKGANVTYAPLANKSTGRKSILNHLGPLLTDQGTARDWVVDRLMGKPAVPNCSSISSMQ